MMKQVLVLVGCFLIFGVGWSFGQQARSTRSGQSWKILDDLDRELYVGGYNNGYSDGVRDVHALAATLSVEGMKSVWGDYIPQVAGVPYVPGPGPLPVPAARDMRLHVTVEMMQGGGSSPMTVGQITDAVSRVYKDSRNLPICWESAILLAKESLEGVSPSDEELASLRAWGARGCN